MMEILEAREKRHALIKEIDFSDSNIIIIKANIPGPNKNIPLAYYLINIFKNRINRILWIKAEYFYDGKDGPYYLLKIDKEDIKEQLIDLEDSHPLGRFIDLDFFINPDKSISRNDIGRGFRKCIICDRPAIQCVREQSHDAKDIIKVINDSFKIYFEDSLTTMIKKSILLELNLEHKFGLVTPTSNGSHQDMDYDLMRKAIDIIVPDLVKMGILVFDIQDLYIAYHRAKEIGINAEKKMLEVTAGVNAYKGLIYILGLAALSCSYTYINQGSVDDIFENIKLISFDKFNEDRINTFGEYAFDNYQFTGARGEAVLGLPSVREVLEFISEYPMINNEILSMALIKAVGVIDDTVLLKRAVSMERYLFFKEKITSIEEYDINKIKEVTEECINNNISCGGAADILITALFINEFINLFW